jgi:stalled ribosome alternative rescue factor ArfA
MKKARKTNLSEDWERYRCFRNRVTNKIKVGKGRYNRQLVDPKAFWKTVKKSFLEKLNKCLRG